MRKSQIIIFRLIIVFLFLNNINCTPKMISDSQFEETDKYYMAAEDKENGDRNEIEQMVFLVWGQLGFIGNGGLEAYFAFEKDEEEIRELQQSFSYFGLPNDLSEILHDVWRKSRDSGESYWGTSDYNEKNKRFLELSDNFPDYVFRKLKDAGEI